MIASGISSVELSGFATSVSVFVDQSCNFLIIVRVILMTDILYYIIYYHYFMD
jgi:hypothetical protein